MTEAEWKIFDRMPAAAQLDYEDANAVAQYLRELISFNQMLVNGFDFEYNRLRTLLLKAGWSENKLFQLMEQGCKGTFYERVLPHRIKDQGDPTEYGMNKGRWKR